MTTSSNSYRIAIIGGGAAGFFAAISAKKTHPQCEVHLFEKSARPLSKVKMTGGGRCNLTNTFEGITDLKQAYPRGAKLLKRLFHCFNHEDAMTWFKAHGVPLVVQTDHCVFPQSQRSQSVIDALMLTAQRQGVVIHCSACIEALQPSEDTISLIVNSTQEKLSFSAVIITTGGEPRLKGWEWLSGLGHKIISPLPSLFTFNIPLPSFTALMGTVVPHALVSIPSTKLRAEGPLLVTHWGVSGPSILRLSAYAARELAEHNYHFPLAIAWAGITNADVVAHELQSLSSATQKHLQSLPPFDLPHRLWEYLILRAGLLPERCWGELGRKGLHRLVEVLTHDIYAVEGRSLYKEEFVTTGGISLSEIDSQTLESKVVPRLYFAGEVLDIDGITGGFNLQAAWTTGFIAGRSATLRLLLSSE